jgi:hypothetical protein
MFVNEDCVPNPISVAPYSESLITPFTPAEQHPESVFIQYGAGAGCGGWENWTVVYKAYNGTIGSFTSVGGCDSNSWVVEPEVTYTSYEI